MSKLLRPAQSEAPRNGAAADAAALYRDLDLQITYLPLEALKGYSRNARCHSESQIQKIADSIAAFGFISPLIIDGENVLIAGHGRHAAAKRLGFARVPVVRIEHLDEAQKRALRIADNKLCELAGWDHELLAVEFKDLLNADLTLDLAFDLAVTGFASPEIDQLIESAAPASNSGTDDAVPDARIGAPPVSRLGDVWRLDEHFIVCGDARDRTVYERLLGDERATMGIHDSPYNVSITKHVSRGGKHGEFTMGVGELSEAAFTAFLADYLRQAAAFSHPGAIQWAFMDWRHTGEMLTAGRAVGLELKNLVVWNKGVGSMGSLLRSQHELVFMFKDPSAPHINNVQLGKFGRTRTNVWDYPGAAGLRREMELHPTPKPVALVADAIRDVSNRGDLVLDCFSGSGTTIIAAAKTGRRARVVELDPHYVDVAVKRWQTWSGGTARYARTGLSFAEHAERAAGEIPAPADRDAVPAPVRARQRRRGA